MPRQSTMTVLFPRLRNNGRAVIDLSPVQTAARQRVLQKIFSHDYVLEDVPCPSCSATAPYGLAEKDMYGLPMNVALCLTCGFVYTSQRLTGDSLRRFYD